MNTVTKLAMLLVAVFVSAAGASVASAVSPANTEMARIIISFDAPVGQAERAAALGFGGRMLHSYDIVDAVAVEVPAHVVPLLKRNPRFRTVEPDVRVYALEEAPDYTAELAYTWGVSHIGAGTAHTEGYTGSSVTVAVVDTGVDCSHPQLVGRCGQGYDFVNNDDDPSDDNGHGTHVAGTIAAIRDGQSVVGVAPDVTIHPLKVLGADGGGYTSDIIEALDWARTNGMQVTNSSLGASSDPGTAFKAAFDNAAAAGIVNVAAAGNAGTCTRIQRDTVSYPARYDSVIAVAAVDSSNARACFSSIGSPVELAAPGVSVTSLVPGGGTATWNGTSMASPHVAGTIALLLGIGATGPEARSTLQRTALDLGTSGRDVQYGYGLVRANVALDNFLNPPTITDMHVPSISYALSGNKRDVIVTIGVREGTTASPTTAVVPGVSVKATLSNPDVYKTWTVSGTTDSQGILRYTVKSAPKGTYTTVLTGITKDTFAWDGVTPANSYKR